MKLPTMEEFAEQVKDRVMKQLEINDMPLEDFIVQANKLMVFLQAEIELCKCRLDDKENDFNQCYDGEDVESYKTARRLQERHMKFCQRMLRMLTDKNAN